MDGFWLYMIFLLALPLIQRLVRELCGGDRQPCPQCAEMVKMEATVCRFCGYHFPAPEPSPEKSMPPVTVIAAVSDTTRIKRLRAQVRLYRFIIICLLVLVVYLASQNHRNRQALKEAYRLQSQWSHAGEEQGLKAGLP